MKGSRNNRNPQKRKKHQENWVKSHKSNLAQEAQKELNKIKGERKGKQFELIKHPIKGYIEREVNNGNN